MSAEQLTALGSLASAAILAIAAIAAIVQLRPVRTANQLQGLLILSERYNSREMLEARGFCLSQDFSDPKTVSRMVDTWLAEQESWDETIRRLYPARFLSALAADPRNSGCVPRSSKGPRSR